MRSTFFACATAMLLAGIFSNVLAADLAGAPSVVVAKQGTATVTLGDVDTFAQKIPADKRAGFFNSPQRIEDAISTMLLQKQLADEARAAHLQKNALVQRQIALATDEALAAARVEEFRRDIKIPDLSELAQEDYVAHKEKYAVAARTEVQQILISDKKRTTDEARTLAEQVRREAIAQPEQFAALVQKYSDDPSKALDQGMVADTQAKRYGPVFVEAARALSTKGAISPIVQAKDGFHVLKLISHTPAHQRTYAEAKDEIIARLRTDYVNKTVGGHTDELRNKPLDANPELVASLRTRYAKSAEAPAIEPRTPSGK